MYDNILIARLAERQGVLDFQELLKNRREKGFQHFIMDLASEPETAGFGWALKKGVLIVQTNHNSDELMAFLENRLQHHYWFETRAKREERIRGGEIIETPQLPPGFDMYLELFKSLGRWGRNPAMDVVTLLKELDGTLSVQVIVRPFDKKYAFVGGMIDKDMEAQANGILQTCYMEFLEEYYSASLFKKGSPSFKAANTAEKVAQLPGLLAALLADKKSFGSIQSYVPALLSKLTQGGLEINLLTLERELKKLSGQALSSDPTKKIRIEDLDHMWVVIKCQLYRGMFPHEHHSMNDFLQHHLIRMPETTNESDPRNTQSGFMTTVPHYFNLDKDELRRMEAQWLVEPKGGDDAISAKIVSLENLFEQSMFSAHGRILLTVVADLVEKNPALLANPRLQEQLAKIEAHIQNRERAGMGMAPHAAQADVAKVVLRPVRGGFSLPATATDVEMGQLSNIAQSAGAAPIEATDSAELARQDLLLSLGQKRFSRLEDAMRGLGLPNSFLVALNELRTLHNIEIILDNSGSMDGQMLALLNAETNETEMIKRWEAARRRLVQLTPLLALAGVKMDVRFLNRLAMISRTDTPADEVFSFDFSKTPGDEEQDAVGLEQKVAVALNWLGSVFKQRPSGGTYVGPHFDHIIKKTKADGQSRFTLFITDGEASDRDVLNGLIANRDKTRLPITVVACTDKPDEIGWARIHQFDPLARFSVLDDFGTESTRLRKAHGHLIHFSQNAWVALHVVPPALPGSPLNESGFFVYHKLMRLGDALTHEQLNEMIGYKVSDEVYGYYLREKGALTAQLGGAVAAAANGVAVAAAPVSTAPSAAMFGAPPPYSLAAPSAAAAAASAQPEQQPPQSSLFSFSNWRLW